MGVLHTILNAMKLTGYKTLLTAVIGLVGLYFPAVPVWISAHPVEAGQLGIIVMVLLRIFTKTPITETEIKEIGSIGQDIVKK